MPHELGPMWPQRTMGCASSTPLLPTAFPEYAQVTLEQVWRQVGSSHQAALRNFQTLALKVIGYEDTRGVVFSVSGDRGGQRLL